MIADYLFLLWAFVMILTPIVLQIDLDRTNKKERENK
jgi:hypothetical protein